MNVNCLIIGRKNTDEASCKWRTDTEASTILTSSSFECWTWHFVIIESDEVYSMGYVVLIDVFTLCD